MRPVRAQPGPSFRPATAVRLHVLAVLRACLWSSMRLRGLRPRSECAMRSYVIGIVLLAAPGGLLSDLPDEPLADRVVRLIKQLGHEKYAKREQASKELEAIGAPALDALRQA